MSASKFTTQLATILSTEDPELICWSQDGKVITVKDINSFSASILPRYFKTSKFYSFVRQMNAYGFRKDNIVMTKNGKRTCEFSHQKFTRDNPVDCCTLKRKKLFQDDYIPRSEYDSLKDRVAFLESQIMDLVGRRAMAPDSSSSPHDSMSMGGSSSSGSASFSSLPSASASASSSSSSSSSSGSLGMSASASHFRSSSSLPPASASSSSSLSYSGTFPSPSGASSTVPSPAGASFASSYGYGLGYPQRQSDVSSAPASAQSSSHGLYPGTSTAYASSSSPVISPFDYPGSPRLRGASSQATSNSTQGGGVAPTSSSTAPGGAKKRGRPLRLLPPDDFVEGVGSGESSCNSTGPFLDFLTSPEDFAPSPFASGGGMDSAGVLLGMPLDRGGDRGRGHSQGSGSVSLTSGSRSLSPSPFFFGPESSLLFPGSLPGSPAAMDVMDDTSPKILPAVSTASEETVPGSGAFFLRYPGVTEKDLSPRSQALFHDSIDASEPSYYRQCF